MKDQPVKYQKEFKAEIDQMTDKLLKLENQRDFIYDPEDESMGKRLFLVRKVNNMVEHTEELGIIITPIWANTIEYISSRAVAQVQFENYYANRNKDLPESMWQAPLKLEFYDVNFDYRLQTYDDNQNIENFSKKFISYDQAFLKYNGEKHREAILSRLADRSFKENFGDDDNGKK